MEIMLSIGRVWLILSGEGPSTWYCLLFKVLKRRSTFPIRSTLSIDERNRLRWTRIPRDFNAPSSIFSPIFGLSSRISWIQSSSLLSSISVYFSEISSSCLFVRNVRSETHKISAIFSKWSLNFWGLPVLLFEIHTSVDLYSSYSLIDIQVRLFC